MSQPSRPKSPDDQTAMYIRVKRNKTTYFLQCVPSETVLQIKEKLEELIDQPVNDQRLILMPNREVLDDSKSLADQKVENDAVVALTLRKDDNEFEEVNIVRPNDFYQSREGDGGSNW
ncbi:RNA polymerase II transcription elongation factor Elongin/SIII, subunit elongin B [Handroanthus impetiginosus]|uniref:RNA polymerase II transcription elongation factor Elongin/SIII, subunit elongin B n=1 Tax=Handroanthus impetiginosus TaxID=429701 RepID=A0A2G9GSL5_9LAMI|nr:RNA polymerase II transcription elongation factor Elongin/SIII, subunit elongin B [Handroanthus impetiginosus]